MTKTVALIGKIGPTFGDGRASHVEVSIMSEYESGEFAPLSEWSEEHVIRVANWPAADRADALRAAFDMAGS